MGQPHLLGHVPTASNKVAFVAVFAAIKQQGIVGVAAIGGGVRVNRKEEVHVVGIHLFANLGQRAVELIVFWVAFHVRIWSVVCS